MTALSLCKIIAATRQQFEEIMVYFTWGEKVKPEFSFERQQGPFKDRQVLKLASIKTGASPLPQSREITHRCHLTAHQASERLPEKYEITCNGCAARHWQKKWGEGILTFFLFSIRGGNVQLLSYINLFTIPQRSHFLIRLLPRLNSGYHYGRAN